MFVSNSSHHLSVSARHSRGHLSFLTTEQSQTLLDWIVASGNTSPPFTSPVHGDHFLLPVIACSGAFSLRAGRSRTPEVVRPCIASVTRRIENFWLGFSGRNSGSLVGLPNAGRLRARSGGAQARRGDAGRTERLPPPPLRPVDRTILAGRRLNGFILPRRDRTHRAAACSGSPRSTSLSP